MSTDSNGSTVGPSPDPAPAHLPAAAALYGTTAAALEPLGAFESDVYRFAGREGPCVLKVMAPTHRTPELVQAEVDWLLALLEAGASVAAPVKTEAGTWVERLPDSGHVVVAFREAPGRLTKPDDWTPELLERWGALLGRLQAHSRAWAPPGPRRHTHADQTYAERVADLPGEDPAFLTAAQELIVRARPLLGAAGSDLDAGLTHADLHHGNFLVAGGELTAIDFDDCAYCAYAFDIAMPLYYAVRAQRELDPAVAAERFLEPFMRGFQRIAPVPGGGADAVDLALRYRQVELVAVLALKLPAHQRNERMRAAEADLRRRVTESVEPVPYATLARFFG